ncbi:MAG TPA: saccharopine dehydrogenase NADP-binding domain-containing protein [Alphaproteobacteria bacterium]|nr:potassium transporter [Rhodospirillaceae bacterium]HRJ65632.1 saccharopine dehydrogenase NADP-binding domain-containing protein [Alphaproteobacteria bacterium]
MSVQKRILILGGYGNFGTYITRELAQDAGFEILVAGRDVAKAATLADSLKHAPATVKPCLLDIHHDFPAALAALAPDIVIHTCGPFQGQGYDIARACIALGCDYIDLADGREYVANIGTLDAQAKAQGCRIISGASSVPAMTAAVIDHYLPAFASFTALDYGISTAQRTTPGVGTAASLLSYAGKPFETLQNGAPHTVYGWQCLQRRTFPQLGTRLMARCDIPDLALFPKRYPALRDITFLAGVEVWTQQALLWLLSGLVRLGLMRSLSVMAGALVKLNPLFNIFGSDRSGFYLRMQGTGHDGAACEKSFYLIARQGHGPHLPTLPALIMARKLLASRADLPAGAMPCVGLMTLDEYIAAIGDLDIEVIRPD